MQQSAALPQDLPHRQPTFTPDRVYLDTATYGLAASSVIEAMTEALDRWRLGRATMAEYDGAVDQARRTYAELVGADLATVAVANQVSVFVGLVADSIPAGATVVVPDGDFTSLLFPLLVQEERGFTVRSVPLEQVADSIDNDTELVAFSLVQSADGRLADVDSIESAARRHGARLLVDATQAVGWLPVDPARFDYMVVSAYKWLLCPRGTAFLTLGPGHDRTMRPLFAGWYAGDEVWKSIYGAPLRLAASARRFDVSPAWFSWIGSVPALEIIAGHGVPAIHRHNLALADAARARLGLPRSASAILTVPLTDTTVLADRGIAASVRADSVRVGFHLYNDTTDVDALVAAVQHAEPGHQGSTGSGNGDRAPSAPRR